MSIDLSVEPAFIITKSSVTFAFPNGESMTLPATHELFQDICNALLTKNWKTTSVLVNRALSIKEQTDGEFTIRDGNLMWDGNTPVPLSLAARILDSAVKKEPKRIYTMFSQRLKQNPSAESRDQLFGFIEHHLPLTDRGTFLAYKAVNSHYRDKHSGKVDNRIGSVVEMLRAHVDANNKVECSTGLHVGTKGYVNSFADKSSDRLLVVEVDPIDVVAVPKHDKTKMRVCRYRILGEISFDTDLPKTFISMKDVSKLFINNESKKAKSRHQPLMVEGTQKNVVGSLFFSDLIAYCERARAKGSTQVSVKNLQSRFKGVSSKTILEMLIDLEQHKPNKKFITIDGNRESPTTVIVFFNESKNWKLVAPTVEDRELDSVIPPTSDVDNVPTVEDINKESTSNKRKKSPTKSKDQKIVEEITDYLLRRREAGHTTTTVKQIQSRFKGLGSAFINSKIELIAQQNRWELCPDESSVLRNEIFIA